jgi:hypothetical protein
LTIAGATKIADLPTDYYHPFCGLDGGTSANHFAAGFAGIVRFSGLNGSKAAAALCGRQQFTFTDNSLVTAGTVAVAFNSAQTNLRVGDTLDFWGVNMGALPANCAVVTRTDDQHFIIAVSFAAMAGAIWATSHGAAAWYWNDVSQKMNGRFGQWNDQNRPPLWSAGMTVNDGDVVTDSNGNYQTASGTGTWPKTTGTTAPTWLTDWNGTVVDNGITWTTQLRLIGIWSAGQEFSPCCPQVIAFTPNNDTDAGWVKEWFGSVTADNVFGSRATLGGEWEMTDPMSQGWLQPIPTNVADSDGETHTTTAFVFLEDDGTSQPDRLDSSSDESGNTTNVWTLYFQPHSRVEALFAVPDGSGGNGTGMTRTEPAPALPVDSLGQAVVWPVMQQPASPGDWNTRDVVTGYELVLDPGQRYANELAAGSTARFARWYLALTLGGGW